MGSRVDIHGDDSALLQAAMGMSAPCLGPGLDSTWSYGELLASLGPQSLTPDQHADEGAFDYFSSPSTSAAWATPGYAPDSPLMMSDSPTSINFEPATGTYTVAPGDTAFSPMWQTRHSPSPELSKPASSRASKRKSSSGSTADSTHLSAVKKGANGKKNTISLRTSRPKRKSKYADSETGASSSLGQLNSANGESLPPTPLDENINTELHLARRTHNHVEKRYRTRLNLQFERLLAVLPSTDLVVDDDRVEGQPAPSCASEKLDKHVSKAEVLEMARQRIRVLERENQQLRQEFGGHEQIYPGACGGVPGSYGQPQQTPQYPRTAAMT